MTIHKIPRSAMRPDDEAIKDTEIWQPSWKCFCCMDSGIIAPHLAAMAIENYNRANDRLPRCAAPGCKAKCLFDTDQLQDCIDYRVDTQVCQELDLVERESWRNTVRMKHQRIVELKQLADKLAMPGSRERTANDDREVQQRKQEVESISHEQWLDMAYQSGGDEQDSSIAM